MKRIITVLFALLCSIAANAQLGINREATIQPEAANMDVRFVSSDPGVGSLNRLTHMVREHDAYSSYVAPSYLIYGYLVEFSKICYYIRLRISNMNIDEIFYLYLGDDKESALKSLDDLNYLLSQPIGSLLTLDNEGMPVVIRIFKTQGIVTRYADERSRSEVRLGIRPASAPEDLIEARLRPKTIAKFTRDLEKFKE